MVDLRTTVTLLAAVLGALGGVLLFVEFFQLPSYVSFEESYGSYSVSLSPPDAREYTWAGRIGALLLGIAFALQFLAALL